MTENRGQQRAHTLSESVHRGSLLGIIEPGSQMTEGETALNRRKVCNESPETNAPAMTGRGETDEKGNRIGEEP